MILICISYWRNVFFGLLLIFELGLFFPFFFFFDVEVYELFIYVRYPWSVTLFANIFSHSVGGLFVLFMVSLAIQKLSSLIRSHLFIFYLISFVLEDRAKKYCYNLCSSVLPVFLWKFYSLRFRSLICFEFIFVYDVIE